MTENLCLWCLFESCAAFFVCHCFGVLAGTSKVPVPSLINHMWGNLRHLCIKILPASLCTSTRPSLHNKAEWQWLHILAPKGWELILVDCCELIFTHWATHISHCFTLCCVSTIIISDCLFLPSPGCGTLEPSLSQWLSAQESAGLHWGAFYLSSLAFPLTSLEVMWPKGC